MSTTVIVYLTIVHYTCGHYRRYGYGEEIKLYCWCHAGIERVEHVEKVETKP